MTDEYVLVADDPHLRQGDVFLWHDRNYQAPWKTYGIIVTANCDLIQRKIPHVSYIPALTMQDFLWSIWRPEKFSQVLIEHETKLESRLNRTLERLRGQQAQISKDAVLAWVSRAGSEKLIDELGLTDPGQRKQLKDIIDAYICIRDLLDREKPDFDLLRKCYALKNKKAAPTEHAELARELQSSIASLPGDVFYFSGVKGEEEFGLFAMLRYISQCDVADLAISPDDLRFGKARAKRIARLNSPYVFALAQNLARVFSDIGLPKDYEERRKNNPVLYFDSVYAEKI